MTITLKKGSMVGSHYDLLLRFQAFHAFQDHSYFEGLSKRFEKMSKNAGVKYNASKPLSRDRHMVFKIEYFNARHAKHHFHYRFDSVKESSKADAVVPCNLPLDGRKMAGYINRDYI